MITLQPSLEASLPKEIFGRDFYQHQNPNGSEGGYVHETADIQEGVFIGIGSVVLEEAKIRSDAHIRENVVVGAHAWVCRKVFIESDQTIKEGQLVNKQVSLSAPKAQATDRMHYSAAPSDENQL